MTAAAATAAAFLDAAHVECAAASRAGRASTCSIGRSRATTRHARARGARAALACLDAAGWLSARSAGRTCARCASSARPSPRQSPLADAVVALQALGGTPLVLAGSGEQRDRWLAGHPRGPRHGGVRDDRTGRGLRRRGDADHGAPGRRAAGSSTARSISSPTPASPTSTSSSRVTSPGAGQPRHLARSSFPRTRPGFAFAGAAGAGGAASARAAALRRLPRARRRAARRDRTAGSSSGMMTLDRLRPTVGAAACGMAARALGRSARATPPRDGSSGSRSATFRSFARSWAGWRPSSQRVAAARVSRGMAQGSRRRADHRRSGDGEELRDRGRAADRRRGGADRGRRRRARRQSRRAALPRRSARCASTKAPRRFSGSSSAARCAASDGVTSSA